MPPLLAAGLEAWARELGGADDQAFVQEPLPGKNPRLHACLRMLLDTRTERQRRWAFRAIASNSPRAVQTRLRKAIEGAGLAAGGVGDAAAGCSCSGRPVAHRPGHREGGGRVHGQGRDAAAGRPRRT